ncbi:MAG: hypothetical protein GW941_00670 [Candidatus Pacebacteria bacterium]|nr:hypothetical protein [Candidatus Paceibacterota bacterium]
MFKKIIVSFLLLSIFSISLSNNLVSLVSAQTNLLRADIEVIDDATASAEATAEASLATPSAEVVERIKEKTEDDITQPTDKQKSKLATYLEETPVGPLSWNNFIQHAIRNAITEGVAPNILVLVLLFPLVASLIGASRHIIGLRGFGIYIPAVLAVALVSTGVFEGIAIFGAIVLVALLAKRLLKRTKLSYLPRTAMLLWVISMGIFGVFLVSPYFGLVSLMSINIFPILILVLLSENFLDAQSRSKQSEAIALTIETLALAFASTLLLRAEFMQKFALTEPELLIMTTVLINVVIGKFAGLRLKEWFRFRSLIEEE